MIYFRREIMDQKSEKLSMCKWCFINVEPWNTVIKEFFNNLNMLSFILHILNTKEFYLKNILNLKYRATIKPKDILKGLPNFHYQFSLIYNGSYFLLEVSR